MILNKKIIKDGYDRKQIREQLLPYSYMWELRKKNKVTHKWWAYFMKNRDATYHTVVSLPKKDLKRSYLIIYF